MGACPQNNFVLIDRARQHLDQDSCQCGLACNGPEGESTSVAAARYGSQASEPRRRRGRSRDARKRHEDDPRAAPLHPRPGQRSGTFLKRFSLTPLTQCCQQELCVICSTRELEPPKRPMLTEE